MAEPALYLFPVPLDNDAPLEMSLPACNVELIKQMNQNLAEKEMNQ